MKLRLSNGNANLISVVTEIVVGAVAIGCNIYATKQAKNVTDAQLKEVQARMIHDLPKQETED